MWGSAGLPPAGDENGGDSGVYRPIFTRSPHGRPSVKDSVSKGDRLRENDARVPSETVGYDTDDAALKRIADRASQRRSLLAQGHFVGDDETMEAFAGARLRQRISVGAGCVYV